MNKRGMQTNPLLKGLILVPILHYLEPVEVLKLQAVCTFFYENLIGVALQSLEHKIPWLLTYEYQIYDSKTGVWPLRTTQRCLTKIDPSQNKVVMFYTTPTDSEFIEFNIPEQLCKITIDCMTLIEPYYLFTLWTDYFGIERFYKYDMMNKILHEMQAPNASHDNFKLCSSGRDYVFLIGTISNKICERYDIHKNKWVMLPPLPEHALTSFWFVENCEFLNVIICPFQINSKVKTVFYRLDIGNPEEWVDVSNLESRPIDFIAKFDISVKYPARI
jgi:hypothetical protein